MSGWKFLQPQLISEFGEHGLQCRDDGFLRKWFGQIAVCTRLTRQLAMFFTAARTADNHWNSGELWIIADGMEELVAVHAGHLQIGNQDTIVPTAESIESFLAIHGGIAGNSGTGEKVVCQLAHADRILGP
jgi:hypothetical protein